MVLYPKGQEKIAEPNGGFAGTFLEVGGSPGDVYRRSSGGEREGIAAESACLRDLAGRTSRFSYIHLPGVSGTGTTVVSGNFLCNEKQVWTSVTGYGRSVKKTGCEIRYTMKRGAITIRKRGREVLVTEYLEHVAGHGVNSN